MAEWIYLDKSGAERGPVSSAQLRELSLSGELAPSQLVKKDGKSRWLPASAVAGLTFPAQRQATESSPPVGNGSSSSAWDFFKKWVDRVEAAGKTIAYMTPLLVPLLGDFFRPVATINVYVLGIAFVVATMSFALWVRGATVFGCGFGKLFLVSGLMALASGCWTWLARNEAQGYLASRYPAVRKLQSAVVTPVEGGVLAKEIRDQEIVAKSAAVSLEAILQDFPARTVRVEAIGAPRVKRRTDSGAILEYDLRISSDQTQYDAVVERLVPALERVAGASGETFVACPDRSASGDDAFGRELANDVFPRDYGNNSRWTETAVAPRRFEIPWETHDTGFEGDWWRAKLDKESQMVVVVNTARSGAHDRTTWRWFHVPKTKAFRPAVRVDVRFLAKDSKELSRERLTLSRAFGLETRTRAVSDENWQAAEAIVSPYLLYGRAYARELKITREVTLTTDEVARLGQVVCSVSAP